MGQAPWPGETQARRFALVFAIAGVLAGCGPTSYHYKYRVQRPVASTAAPGGSPSCIDECRRAGEGQIDACLAGCPGVTRERSCEADSEFECVDSEETYSRESVISLEGGLALGVGVVAVGVVSIVGAANHENDESYWYKVTAADAGALALGVTGAALDRPELRYGGLAVYALASPAIHWSIEDKEAAAASILLRAGVPLFTGSLVALGSFIGGCNPLDALYRVKTGVENTESMGDCIARRTRIGFLFGVVAAAVVDVAVNSYLEDEEYVISPLPALSF